MENTNAKIVLYTQTGLSILLIGSWVYLIVSGINIPPLFDTVIGIVIGAYFTRNGKLLQEQSARLFRKKPPTDE